jgi:hypothetical protein
MVEAEDALVQRARAYLDGVVPLQDVREALTRRELAADADAAEQPSSELADHLWVLVSELDYGHRDESSIRHELRSLLHAATASHGVRKRVRIDGRTARNPNGPQVPRPRRPPSGS